MNILLIISLALNALTVICIVYFIIMERKYRIYKIPNYPGSEEYQSGISDTTKKEYRFTPEEQKMKKLAFTQTGELLHSFDCMMKQKSFKFAPLINTLGEFVRCMYWDSKPIMNFWTFIQNRNLELPCLNSKERLEINSLLEQIVDGKQKPEILIELCNRLMLENDFNIAMMKTIHNSAYQNIEQEESELPTT